jgi:hypothetical protein
MIAREYLTRQAATLLKLAKVASSPREAAAFTNKAAELQARCSEARVSDTLPTAPEIKIK